MIVNELMEAYKLFNDEVSKTIFSSKVKWYFQGMEDETISYLYELYEDSRILDLEKYQKEYEYVVCGAGNYGRKTIKALEHAGYKVRCILDNDRKKSGQYINGISVCSPAEFVGNADLNNNTVVIIDNMRLCNVFFNELFELGFPQERIYRTKDDIIRTAFGNIYYDLNEMTISDNEVFIDAGSFNGESTIEFINMVCGKYEKIYACEPMTDGFNLSCKNLADYKNVEVLKVALGNECKETTFAQSFSGLMGSRIGENGDYIEKVQIDTIDCILNGERASFIKMDIEGAELDALKGAEYTLRTYKPKLAISLYHNNEDLYAIPLWIKSIVPEYKFYLRHYSNKRWDLVLYCIAE